jgi:hypothetical protein
LPEIVGDVVSGVVGMLEVSAESSLSVAVEGLAVEYAFVVRVMSMPAATKSPTLI